MRALAGGFVLGVVATWLALGAFLRAIGSTSSVRQGFGARMVKQNYRGRTVIAPGGIVLLAAVAVAAQGAPIVATVAGGMAVLGFVDDLFGSRQAGGLFGHAKELLRGRLTTGMVKAGGGALIGLAGAWWAGHRGAWIVVGGAAIALAANMANLFDLRPARTTKVFLPCAVALALSAPRATGVIVAAALGGALLFAVYELREVVMLGDVGSNLIGAVAGTSLVVFASDAVIGAAAAVLLGLTLVAERFSFSEVISKTPPLRWLDELGRVGIGP